MRITVDTQTFCTALAACVPHVIGGRDPGVLGMLRVQLTPERLWVMAASGQTACMATAALDDEAEGLTGDPSWDAFHLTVDAVKSITAVFEPAAKVDPTQLMVTIELDDAGQRLTFQDVSGLFGGSELQVTSPIPDPTFPNVAASVMPASHGPEEMPAHQDIDPGALARWIRTTKATGTDLTITGNGRTATSYLVAAGPNVRGLATIRRYDPDDEDTPDYTAREEGWTLATEAIATALRRMHADKVQGNPVLIERGASE